MKTGYFNVVKILCSIIFAGAACLLVLRQFKECPQFFVGESSGCDFRMRHNEIRCSHTGVDPFDVWEGKAVHAEFKGLVRPDREPDPSSKRKVHSYPPWHTAYMWWIGYLPHPFARLLFAFLCGWAACYGWSCFRRAKPIGVVDKCLFYSAVAALLLNPALACLSVLNYSIVAVALTALMLKCLTKRQDILAGVVWALLMTKPQISLLFVWPLFWGRKWRTIVTAVVVCLVSALWPAYVYQCNPLKLFLQMGAAGAPYVSWSHAITCMFLNRLFGPGYLPFWMGACFLMCGLWSYTLRDCRTWVCRFVPAVAFSLIWTYVVRYDFLTRWPLLFVVAFALWGRQSVTPRVAIGFCLWALMFFIDGLFNIVWYWELDIMAGLGWLYWVIQAMYLVLTFNLLHISVKDADDIFGQELNNTEVLC